MTSIILIVTLLTYFASPTNAFVLKDVERSHDDVSGGLSPLVVPLYISQYTGYRGSSVSFPEEYYQLTVGVGKSARDFNLTLGNYGGENLLFASNYTVNSTCAAKQPARNLYTISDVPSDGIGLLGSDFFGQPYLNPSCSLRRQIMGDYLTDALQIANKPVGKLDFNIVEKISSLNPQWKSDGIFAYFMNGMNDDSNSFLKQFRNVSTVLHLLSAAQASDVPTLGGHLIFGADKEDSMCSGNWTVLNPDYVNPYPYVRIDGATIGNAHIDGFGGALGVQGTLRLTSSYLEINTKSLDSIVKALDAEYQFATDSYTLDCEKIPSLPDMVFRIGTASKISMEYRVPARVYARKVDPTQKFCTLMVRECDSDDRDCVRGYMWRLGTTFSRPYCQRIQYPEHGYHKSVLSFAKALF